MGLDIEKARRRYAKQLEHDRTRYAADPEYRRKRLQMSEAWRQNNRDHINEYQRQHRAMKKRAAANAREKMVSGKFK